MGESARIVMCGKIIRRYTLNGKEIGGKMRKTYTRSLEDRIKISERSKKRWSDPNYKIMMSEKIKSNHVSWNKGKKMKDLGYKEWGFVKRLRSEEFEKRRITAVQFSRIGKKASPETIKKLRDSHFRKNNMPLYKRVRYLWEAEDWKKRVKERDGNKCIKCGSIEFLHVDHIVSLRTLYDEFISNHSQFDELKDKDDLARLAMKWDKFWDIKNGRTLCAKCHRDR